MDCEAGNNHKNGQRKEELSSVIIRFAGDSGDGVQIAGTHFTNESAVAGNDIATLPNFPSEIRAPSGSLAGVSGFQINFGSDEIDTPGDNPDVLVALNPAALRANLNEVKPGGILILNQDSFDEKNLKKVGYAANPCEDPDLRARYRVYSVPIGTMTRHALKSLDLEQREVERCKNFFALGITSWMFTRPIEPTLKWIERKFSSKPELIVANTTALKAGIDYASQTEVFPVTFMVKPAKLKPGVYRNMNGSLALSLGLIAASKKSGLPLFYGAYPITPASEILHELAHHKRLGVTTFQAEDEIAAICAALGAAYAGNLAVTGSSGPGISLKTEALGLAVMTELPLVIIDVQRAGPSTGMPTKTEQADLLQAFYGRSGEAPMCILAVSSPNSSFLLAYEACRIALKYMTPVFLLSEGFIANTSGPWRIPDPSQLPEIQVSFCGRTNNANGPFLPYLRDEKTLARPWALPGTAGLMHRIGGLEKADKTGAVSYDGDNHELMCRLRARKIAQIADDIPLLSVDGDKSGELLVVGWGGTEGAIKQAVRNMRKKGLPVSRAHLHYLNPFPRNFEATLRSFTKVLVPEMNGGQLRSIIRDRFLIDAQGLNRLNGQPLKIAEIEHALAAACGSSY